MPAIRQLELIIPGLGGPASDHPVTDYLHSRPHALDRLLSRSRSSRTDQLDPDAVLLQACGIASDSTPPVAGLTGLADLDAPQPRHLLRADPVHLRADQSCLRLFETHSFGLTRAEADALAASINAFVGERGWQLLAPVPGRWYLSLPEPPALTVASPYQVAGRNIDPWLPTGPGARRWRVLLNELQMLLHDHPVNIERQERGQPAVNSLWFWGGGMPQPAPAGPPAVLYGSSALVEGLACHTGVLRHALPEHAAAVLAGVAGGRVVVLLDALQWPACYCEVERWQETLAELERNWFAPLLRALDAGAVGELVIDGCAGARFRTSRWRQRAFWQTLRNYEECLPS